MLEGNRRQQFPADCAIIVYRHTATLVTDTTTMARQLQGCTVHVFPAFGCWGLGSIGSLLKPRLVMPSKVAVCIHFP